MLSGLTQLLFLFCYFGAKRLGEAFLDKASGLPIKFVARMLRPYKNRDSFPEITKEGLEAIAQRQD